MKKRRPFTLEECARHEAGHFVAYLDLGRPCANLVASAFDEPDDEGCLGRVESQNQEPQPDPPKASRKKSSRVVSKELREEDPKLARMIDDVMRLDLARDLIFWHAGAAAQFVYPSSYPPDLFVGAQRVMRYCNEAAWEAGYWPPERWDYAHYAARSIVDRRFGEVMAIARVLARRRRLLGPEMLDRERLPPGSRRSEG